MWRGLACKWAVSLTGHDDGDGSAARGGHVGHVTWVVSGVGLDDVVQHQSVVDDVNSVVAVGAQRHVELAVQPPVHQTTQSNI